MRERDVLVATAAVAAHVSDGVDPVAQALGLHGRGLGGACHLNPLERPAQREYRNYLSSLLRGYTSLDNPRARGMRSTALRTLGRRGAPPGWSLLARCHRATAGYRCLQERQLSNIRPQHAGMHAGRLGSRTRALPTCSHPHGSMFGAGTHQEVACEKRGGRASDGGLHGWRGADGTWGRCQGGDQVSLGTAGQMLLPVALLDFDLRTMRPSWPPISHLPLHASPASLQHSPPCRFTPHQRASRTSASLILHQVDCTSTFRRVLMFAQVQTAAAEQGEGLRLAGQGELRLLPLHGSLEGFAWCRLMDARD